MSVKKRLIFEILFDSGNICISRNFRLQKMGSIDWFHQSFSVLDLTKHIDELTIINLSDSVEYDLEFNKFVSTISSTCFAPLTLGGRIKNKQDAKKYLDMGADKIILNRNFFNNVNNIVEISDSYGQQFLLLSIDYSGSAEFAKVFSNQGKELICKLSELPLEFINRVAGEVILRSINQDGTGNGLDVKITENPIVDKFDIPIILAGGAGKPSHISEALKIESISGVATSNLINFIGDGLKQTRVEIKNTGIEIPKFISWDKV